MTQHADNDAVRLRRRDLKDLRWHWGRAYEISWDGQFRASRRDDLAELAGSTAQDLRQLLRDDYIARPVRRDDEDQAAGVSGSAISPAVSDMRVEEDEAGADVSG